MTDFADTSVSELRQQMREMQRIVEELSRRDGAQPPVGPKPTGVLLGVGGEPLMLGLPIFDVGYLLLGALGVLLGIGVLPPSDLGVFIPVVLFATALFEAVTAGWAILLAQSLVAEIFGLFAGFGWSLGILLLGVDEHWFAIPTAQVPIAEALFFGAWGILFVVLTWHMLKLPAVYPVLLVVVDIALALAAAWAVTGNATLLVATGAAVLGFTFLGFWAWITVGEVSNGENAFPPLGPPLRPLRR